MADSTHKTCSRCREALPATDFHKSASSKTGLSSYCKPCTREYLRENRAKNPERTRAHGRENMRRRRESDPERVTEYQAEWRAANPEKVAAAQAAWVEANYEHFRARANRANRKWKATNADKVKAGDIAWKKANPTRVAVYQRNWRQANPIAVRQRKSLRRAIIRATSVGPVDLHLLWQRQCGTCALCHTQIDPTLAWPDPASRSVDHIVPLALGGTHEQSNLQWTHLVCNLKKGAKAP